MGQSSGCFECRLKGRSGVDDGPEDVHASAGECDDGLMVSLSFAALVSCYVGSDFSVRNVFENSHSAMPLIYKFTSTWGNHEGSMLLWVLILTLFGALVALFGNNIPASLKAIVLSVQAWIAGAFYLFILITSNPFLRIANPPIEGRDTPAMAIIVVEHDRVGRVARPRRGSPDQSCAHRRLPG